MNNKPLLLDCFSGAGGAAMGYYQAGFEVIGVDIKPQKNYPFRFIRADALEFIRLCGHWFDVIHASPPCQRYSRTKSIHNRKTWGNKNYPMLLESVRELLQRSGKPYIIENVEDAPLINPITLCGSMFTGLRVYRHRLFETNPPIYWPPMMCNHSYSMPASKGAYHTLANQDFITCVGHNFKASDGRIAMGIDWMTRDELAESIPPKYTRWIGEQLMNQIGF